jgi:hypothetical protein
MTRPDLKRGDAVLVTEPGIRPWRGTVATIKPTRASKHGDALLWWVEIIREDLGAKIAYVVSAGYVEKLGSANV